MHPKFHWLVHLPKHLEKFKLLPTCWVHERKHRMVKRYASDVYNTTSYDRTILSEVTAHHMSALDDKSTFDFSVGLLVSRQAPAKLRAFLMAQCGLDAVPAQFCRTALAARNSECSICHKGDVVIIAPKSGAGFDVGMVWAHAELFGEALSLVSVWERVSVDRQLATAEYREVTNVEVMPLSDILAPVIFCRPRAGIARVLVPATFRSFL